MRIFAVVAAVLLSGCASGYTWQHPGIDPALAESQFEIDSGECTAIAMRALPTPLLPTAPTKISVNVAGAGGVATGGGSWGSTLEGEEAQQVLQNAYENESARAGLTNACMYRRGWVKSRRSQQQAVATSLNVGAASSDLLPAQTSDVASDAASLPPLPPPLPPPPGRAPTYNNWLKDHQK